MFSVILLVVIALVFGVFATQNTIGIPITIGSLVIPDVPLYIVLGVTLLIGLLFSWLLSLANSLLFSMRLRDKDSAFAEIQKENEALHQKVIDLEIENTRLAAQAKHE
jgi:cell shape-determining protein MreC